MGSGVSKRSRNLNLEDELAQMDIPDLKPKVGQHRPLQNDQDHRSDVNKEHNNEERREMISLVEGEALLTRTYMKYADSFPELEDYLITIFNSLRKLRKAIDNNDDDDDDDDNDDDDNDDDDNDDDDNDDDDSDDDDNDDNDDDDNVEDALKKLFKTSCRTTTNDPEQSNTLVNFFVEIEGATVLHGFVKNCFEDFYDERDNEVNTSDQRETLCSALATIQNFADSHHGFCLASAQDGVVLTCMENIERIDRENDDWQDQDKKPEIIFILEACTGILHNISRRLRDRQWFANSDETLLYFAKVKVASIAASALLCLAYLVNEETNHLISANKNLLRFIIRMLDEAWQSEDRRSDGFSVKELAEGLSHLAINDDNKEILGNEDAISVLTFTIMTSSDEEEQESAARALWMLAFDDSNKDIIRQGEQTMEILRTLHHSQNAEVQRVAAGALWEIEGKTA